MFPKQGGGGAVPPPPTVTVPTVNFQFPNTLFGTPFVPLAPYQNGASFFASATTANVGAQTDALPTDGQPGSYNFAGRKTCIAFCFNDNFDSSGATVNQIITFSLYALTFSGGAPTGGYLIEVSRYIDPASKVRVSITGLTSGSTQVDVSIPGSTPAVVGLYFDPSVNAFGVVINNTDYGILNNAGTPLPGADYQPNTVISIDLQAVNTSSGTGVGKFLTGNVILPASEIAALAIPFPGSGWNDVDGNPL